MYEVEIKVRADHAPLREILDERDATALDTVTQADTYYNGPVRDFAETDEALRIRRERTDSANRDEETSKLTYKGPLVDDDTKTREEHETTVGDGDTIEATLEALGFAPVATVEKRRERFVLAGYMVTLDAVTGLGEFVEVETEADDGELEDASEGVRTILDSLGLDPDDGIRTSYLELLLDDR